MQHRQAFFLEYLLTMMLTFVVYAVVDPSNHTKENATSGPHAVGMAVAGTATEDIAMCLTIIENCGVLCCVGWWCGVVWCGVV